MATFFFCGIGGIGMSAIALYLKKTGHTVMGSDRSFDNGLVSSIYKNLTQHGIKILPQDGSGITPHIDVFVVSTAVENTIPDVKRAQELELTILKRSELLASIFHQYKSGIAVAGTSGKTTVTAMIGHILSCLHMHPTMINGGIGLNTYNNESPSNFIYGTSDICVIEADESDGSIDLYDPAISVLTNISLDHKSVAEVRDLFTQFLNRTQKGVVVNLKCPETAQISIHHPNVISFSTEDNPKATICTTHVRYTASDIHFKIKNESYTLPFIGAHNLENALAAICACLHLEISVAESITALHSFLGTKRRLQVVGKVGEITVIDDYGHNTEKIKATLSALKLYKGPLFIMYQPHGFGPLRLMKTDLIEMLKENLNDDITWIMSDILYKGGTVTRDISSHDIITPLQATGKKALYLPTRSEILAYLTAHAQPGSRIVVMGARDDSLSDFAVQILENIKEKACL